KPDTPEMALLCDALRQSHGNALLELALSSYVSRLIVSTIANLKFRASLKSAAGESAAAEKRERIEKLRAELAKLEAE
ncbi:hypothetical protein, partial [Pseudomonas alloputida]